MKKIYVTIVYSGQWEDKETDVIYAGSNYKQAQVIPERWIKDHKNVGSISIEHWVNGKKEKEETMKYYAVEGYVLSKES